MKSEGAFLTIGELSSELNVKPHILRYWEEQFPTLQPLKRAGKRRHYRPEDVEIVRTINRLLNDEGYTVKGARKYLSSKRGKPQTEQVVAGASGVQVATGHVGPSVVAELQVIRDRLQMALEQS